MAGLHLESSDGSLGGHIMLEGVCKVVQLGGGVAVHRSGVVGVREDDLLRQPADVHVLKPAHQLPAARQYEQPSIPHLPRKIFGPTSLIPSCARAPEGSDMQQNAQTSCRRTLFECTCTDPSGPCTGALSLTEQQKCPYCGPKLVWYEHHQRRKPLMLR